MPPPSKPRREIPERSGTQIVEGPAIKTEASVVRGRQGDGAPDPERETGTHANAKMPRRPPRKAPSNPTGTGTGERYQTGNAYAGDETEGGGDYRTGSNYNALDEPSARPMDLSGDGLDALEPEVDLPAPASDEEDSPPEGEADDSHTHAGPPLKLEIVEGPGAGKVRKFSGVRMVLGRTTGVDFQLEDQSVSRRHVELVVGDEGVLLRDLGSGNGTKVNGEKVTEKTLEHGDTITIGKTTLRFVDEVAALRKEREADEAPPAESAQGDGAEGAEAAGEGEAPSEGEGSAQGPKTGTIRAPGPLTARQQALLQPQGLAGIRFWPLRKKLLVLGAPGVLVMLGVLFVATRPPAPPPEDPRRKDADQAMQLARDAVKAGKYEEAIGLVENAQRLVPAIDVTGVGSAARSALAVSRALDEAKAAIAQHRFDDARAALAGIKDPSLAAEDEKGRVAQALQAAELEYRKQKVTELLVAGELDAAAQAIAVLPPAEQAGSLEQLRQAREQAAALEAQEKRSAAVGAAAAKRSREARREEEVELALAVVTRKFTGQEWARAAAECDRVIDQHPGDDELRKRAKSLQALIPAFGAVYEEGMKKFRGGLLIQSARPLKKARELYGKIGLASPLGEELAGALSESAIAAGNDALLRDDLASAAAMFREARRLSPDEPRAGQGLEKAIAKAEELYMTAYGQRDRDPREAVRLFRIVADVTPPGSATHEKAKNQITQMAP